MKKITFSLKEPEDLKDFRDNIATGVSWLVVQLQEQIDVVIEEISRSILLLNQRLDVLQTPTPDPPPIPHASTHKNLGTDEISTSTPTPNAIPKADANGRLESWSRSAPVVSSFSAAGQTSTISAVDLLATSHTAGVYRVSCSLNCTTAGSAGTATLNLYWTGNSIARGPVPVVVVNLNNTTPLGAGFSTPAFYSDGTSAIQYDVTLAGAAGSPQFAVYLVLEKIL
jgi:hypothetical protein